MAVGGVVIHDSRALLIRRGQPPLEGRWSIPGGILEVGETIAEGIERELREETGVQVRVLELIEIYEKVFRDRDDQPQYHFVILDYLCDFVEGTAEPGGDVTEVVWASEQQLDSLALTGAANRVIRKALSAVRGGSADVGIDFVGDPIVGEHDGEERPDGKKGPAPAAPEITKAGILHGQIGKISGAVTKIREHGENQKSTQVGPSKGGAKMGPRGHNPDDDDGDEDKIVEDAAALPIADGVGEDAAQVRRLQMRGRFGCVHGKAPARR